MSHLRLYRPDHDALVRASAGDSEPAIFSIAAFRAPRHGKSPSESRPEEVKRARLIHANRTCTACGRTTVRPLELRDALLNRNLMPVPGTATLVGFRCHSCQSEWSLAAAR